MKNINFKQTGRFIRLLMAEQNLRFHLSPITFSVVVVLISWLMAKDMEQGILNSINATVPLIFIIPTEAFLTSLLRGKTGVFKQLLPVSSQAKYLSVWGAGLAESVVWLMACFLLTGLCWGAVGYYAFGKGFSEVWSVYTASYHPEQFSVAWLCMAGFTLWSISARQKDNSKYGVPAIFLCSILLWIAAPIMLDETVASEHLTAVRVLMTLLAVLMTFGAILWGYRFFKRIEFIHK